jgi:hypothetical protein
MLCLIPLSKDNPLIEKSAGPLNIVVSLHHTIGASRFPPASKAKVGRFSPVHATVIPSLSRLSRGRQQLKAFLTRICV